MSEKTKSPAHASVHLVPTSKKNRAVLATGESVSSGEDKVRELLSLGEMSDEQAKEYQTLVKNIATIDVNKNGTPKGRHLARYFEVCYPGVVLLPDRDVGNPSWPKCVGMEWDDETREWNRLPPGRLGKYVSNVVGRVYSDTLRLDDFRQELMNNFMGEPPDKWDDLSNGFVGLQNGMVFNTYTGKVGRAKRNMLLTRRLNATGERPSEEARAKLNKLICGWIYNDYNTGTMYDGKSRARWFRRRLGNILRGRNRNRELLVIHGESGSGKTAFAEILTHLFGGDDNYQVEADENTLLQTGRAQEAAVNISRLRGRLLATLSEVDDRKTWSAKHVKIMTGNDQLVGRALYRMHESFKPMFTLVVFCNNLPDFNQFDEVAHKRIKPLRFYRAHGDDVNRNLVEECCESSDFMNALFEFLVEGYADNAADDYTPAGVKETMSAYREDMLPFAEFIEDCMDEREGGRVKIGDFLKVFCQWSAHLKNSSRTYGANNHRQLIKDLTNAGYALERESRGKKKRRVLLSGWELNSRGKDFLAVANQPPRDLEAGTKNGYALARGDH